MASAGGIDLKEEIAKLKMAGVKIHPLIWDTMYLYLADYLSVINLCCFAYLYKKEPITIDDSKKLQSYTRKATHIINMILHPENIQKGDQQLEPIQNEAMKMNTDVKELIRHFVHNDLHVMGLIIDDCLDPIGPIPISVELTQKIFDRSSLIISVLEELRIELRETEVGF